MATIITVHIPTNDAPSASRVCPGIRTQAIDIFQPPGIGIAGIDDIEAHRTTVNPALPRKSRDETTRNARCDDGRGATGPSVVFGNGAAAIYEPACSSAARRRAAPSGSARMSIHFGLGEGSAP